jgi:hypothetical protein
VVEAITLGEEVPDESAEARFSWTLQAACWIEATKTVPRTCVSAISRLPESSAGTTRNPSDAFDNPCRQRAA